MRVCYTDLTMQAIQPNASNQAMMMAMMSITFLEG